ncbi:MAG: ATP-binding protein [Spirochaetales bacterium]|uniref:histidine kinase n=1 Tax=Candidatus Thalassospirochaeta sargassi TaxID=3119039 RepID=A0AAJ1MKW2_9SPIO|nr:ATP-binding protein [Spirochaetales bacterium]
MKTGLNTSRTRFQFILGIVLYCSFGILDYFMLPIHRDFAWLLRYAVVAPFCFIILGLTFTPILKRYTKLLVYCALIVGQLSIMAMLAVASPLEPAFYGYYVGTVVMLLSCEFMFEFSFRHSFFYFIFSIIMYLIIAVFYQKMPFKENLDYNRNWLIGNFFFFIFIGGISLTGIRHLMKNRDEANHANLMKSSFLANISHEIRTPLNGLTGCARLLASPETTEEQKHIFSSIINTSSEQLLDIVDSILTMSEIENRRSVLDLTEIKISDFLYSIVQQFSFQAEEKGLGFNYDNLVTPDRDAILTDARKLRMILNNLLSNALKFTDEGSLSFKAGFVSDGLRFVLEDTGIGFSQDHADRIFESFYQADRGYSRKYGGNGLGLAITKSFTEMLGGTITAQSEPGQGSIFTLTIPVDSK